MNGGKEMKKILVVIMIIVMTLAMAACGSASDSGGAEGSYDEQKSAGFSGAGSYMADAPASAEEDLAEYGGETIDTPEPERNAADISLPAALNKENVKLIFTADLRVQTMDFEETEKQLYDMVEAFGGYFESIYTDNGNYYYTEDSYKYAGYTVRVPSDKFHEFIGSVSDGMHVVSMSQNAQDVGQAYFDTERRLETLKNKHDRLEELLSQATNMTDIIELEGALSDTEYQIEQYTSDLQRYDSLIDYSTVTVEVEKVSGYSQAITDELTFGQRLLRSIKKGAEDFGWWLEDMAEWFGYHIIQLVILAAVIVIFVKLHLVSKIKGLFGKKKTERYVIVDNRKNDGSEEK